MHLTPDSTLLFFILDFFSFIGEVARVDGGYGGKGEKIGAEVHDVKFTKTKTR